MRLGDHGSGANADLARVPIRELRGAALPRKAMSACACKHWTSHARSQFRTSTTEADYLMHSSPCPVLPELRRAPSLCATEAPETSSPRTDTAAGVAASEGAPAASFAKELTAIIPNLRFYAASLHRYNESDKDDLVQTTLLRAWQRRELFESGTDLRAWTFTIMHNAFVARMRRAYRRYEVYCDPQEDQEARQAPTAAAQEVAILVGEVHKHLRTLPSTTQQLLLMAVDHDHAAIIRAIGLSASTVRSRLSRARSNLRQWVERGTPAAPAIKPPARRRTASVPTEIGVGAELRLVRRARHLSIRELADRIGVTGTNLSYWENGKRPIPVRRLRTLAVALVMPEDWFLALSGGTNVPGIPSA
jgi:RNA polymerase sigma-70 factor (ECF subfamily)